VCAGCGASGYRFCPDCYNQIKLIDQDQVCSQCGIPFAPTDNPPKTICPACRETLTPTNQIRSWAIYQGPLRKAVQGLKYHRNLALGDYFAPALVEVFQAQHWDIDLVVPVPLSPNRRRQRGYNQAEILAFPFALAIQKPIDSRALTKYRETPSQVGRSANERRENVKGAFTANPKSVSGHRVVLIDDVITTGATLNECAVALFKAGANAVFGLTLARALSHAEINFKIYLK